MEVSQPKDKDLVKDSSLVVIDAIVDNIPLLNIAWGLFKSLYGAGLKFRQQRALEWVEMVRDNPHIFTEHILKDEKFQDGFVYALEKYIPERVEKKREYLRLVFLGFAQESDKNNFELERIYHAISILNLDDISFLRKVNAELTDDFHTYYEKTSINNEKMYNLISGNIG